MKVPSTTLEARAAQLLADVLERTMGLSDMADWMGALADTLTLREILMPGSHDAGVYREVSTKAGFLSLPKSWTTCQSMSGLEQSDAGSRFFDVRLKVLRAPHEEGAGRGWRKLGLDWMKDADVSGETVCVMSPIGARRDAVADGLSSAGVPVSVIKADSADTASPGAVRVATMHRAKGLEFDRVVALAPKGVEPAGGSDIAQLMYVSLTRAKTGAVLVRWSEGRRGDGHTTNPAATGRRHLPTHRAPGEIRAVDDAKRHRRSVPSSD